jgi:hypothetical protein
MANEKNLAEDQFHQQGIDIIVGSTALAEQDAGLREGASTP